MSFPPPHVVVGNNKRKAVQVNVGDDIMEIIPLGAGQEVGRSCMVLKFKGRTIMFDCGIHPGYSGMEATPFFGEVDASQVDLLLLTHFHLDHIACLPYFTERTTFEARCLRGEAKVYVTPRGDGRVCVCVCVCGCVGGGEFGERGG